jgi:hypothetical protein
MVKKNAQPVVGAKKKQKEVASYEEKAMEELKVKAGQREKR